MEDSVESVVGQLFSGSVSSTALCRLQLGHLAMNEDELRKTLQDTYHLPITEITRGLDGYEALAELFHVQMASDYADQIATKETGSIGINLTSRLAQALKKPDAMRVYIPVPEMEMSPDQVATYLNHELGFIPPAQAIQIQDRNALAVNYQQHETLRQLWRQSPQYDKESASMRADLPQSEGFMGQMVRALEKQEASPPTHTTTPPSTTITDGTNVVKLDSFKGKPR